jgi:hypothetical protein
MAEHDTERVDAEKGGRRSKTNLPLGDQKKAVAQPEDNQGAQLAGPEAILGLQQTRGNAYVQHLLKSRAVQAKLTVNPPDDQYEREADRIADSVVKSPQSIAQRQTDQDEVNGRSSGASTISPVQRKAMRDPNISRDSRASIQRQAKGEEEEEKVQTKIQRQAKGEEEEEKVQTKIQRQAKGEEEEEKVQTKIQRQAKGEEEEEKAQTKATERGVPEVSHALEERINITRGSGEALPDSVRASFEPHFGRDLSEVRVHSDSEADDLSRSLGAKAFTTGKDIFFRSGDYEPASDNGRRLLGHEMTHVVQQGAATLSRQPVDNKEKDGAVAKESAKQEVNKAVEKLRAQMTREHTRNLLIWAQNCQSIGEQAEATKAIGEATRLAVDLLKSQIAQFDEESARRGVVVDMLKLTEEVMRLGGDQKAIDAAIQKALAWAQSQLNKAVRRLKEAPTREAAVEVAKIAAEVILLGGEPRTEAIEAASHWREGSVAKEESGRAK